MQIWSSLLLNPDPREVNVPNTGRRFGREMNGWARNSMMTSAYIQSLKSWKPLEMEILEIFWCTLMALAMGSIARAKSRGERRHPWRAPKPSWKSSIYILKKFASITLQWKAFLLAFFLQVNLVKWLIFLFHIFVKITKQSKTWNNDFDHPQRDGIEIVLVEPSRKVDHFQLP